MAEPVSNLADGNLKVLHVPAIADPESPTVAELSGGTVIDLSEYLTSDGYAPGGDEAVVTDDRLGSTATFERPGRHTDTLTLRYVYRAQDAAGTDNKAFHTLKHLTTGYIVTRWGQDHTEAVAAGDVVDVLPVQYGKQMKQPPEANSVLKILQRVFVRAGMERDVVVDA